MDSSTCNICCCQQMELGVVLFNVKGERGVIVVGTEQAGMAVQSKLLIPPSFHVVENSLADETAATYN